MTNLINQYVDITHPIFSIALSIRLKRYLSLCDAVDDGLQCFVRVTLEDSLHAACSGGNGLLHRHVQVVVVFLGCEVLNDASKEKTILFCHQRLVSFEHAVASHN